MASRNLLFGLGETGVSEYRAEADRLFLQQLHARSIADRWCGDGWSMFTDRTVVTGTSTALPFTTLRVDFFDGIITLGHDPTHQVVGDIDPDHPETINVRSPLPAELADRAADWIKNQLTPPPTRSKGHQER